METTLIIFGIFVFLFWFASKVMAEVRFRMAVRDRLEKQHNSQVALERIAYIGNLRQILTEVHDFLSICNECNSYNAEQLRERIMSLLKTKHTTTGEEL